MYNWHTDTTRLKNDPKKYEVFVLEQKINFGLNNSKLSLENIKKHWDRLVIDPAKKKYLKSIVWTRS